VLASLREAWLSRPDEVWDSTRGMYIDNAKAFSRKRNLDGQIRNHNSGNALALGQLVSLEVGILIYPLEA